MKRGWTRWAMLIILMVALVPHTHADTELQHVSLSLDGVDLTLSAPFLPAPFITPEPDMPIQVTTAVKWEGFQEISITAIPFGSSASTEDLPAAQIGSAPLYRAMLQNYRQQQGGTPQTGPTAHLFGKQIASSVSVVDLPVDGPAPQPVIITEWVAEAGPRLWILRISQVEAGGPTSRMAEASFVNALSQVRLSSKDVHQPSTSAAAQNLLPPTLSSPPPPAGLTEDLPFPPWWDGDCDTNYYYAHSGIWAYPLGGAYRGVKACGPRPYQDDAPNVLVRFFPGAWGEYEWQCVELSMRYLYLAHGIEPYSANGNRVVWNYPGTALEKIPNGTVGKAPQPGDVLSYNLTAPYGHTSVVAASSVDAQGNGSLTIIEQNAAPSGVRTHTVANWYVQDAQDISGWLTAQDTTPPTVSFAAPAANRWYNTNRPLLWNITDHRSGVRGYQAAWDTPPTAGPEITAAEGITNLNAAGQGWHTLYVQAWDNVTNTVTASAGPFGYDTTLPTVTLLIDHGAITAAQTTVALNLTYGDTGSGVRAVRASNNGLEWSAWRPVAAALPWTLPTLDLATLPVYVQVRDGAGNLSAVISDTIALDLSPLAPHSAHYRMCGTTLNTGGGTGITSTDYTLVSAIGQAWPSGAEGYTGATFTAGAGLLADGAGCRAAARPAPRGFTIPQSVVAAGGATRNNAGYRLGDTAGEALVSGVQPMQSAGYQISGGFWGYAAAATSPKIYLPQVLRSKP